MITTCCVLLCVYVLHVPVVQHLPMNVLPQASCLNAQYHCISCVLLYVHIHVQFTIWNLSNQDSLGTEESVLISPDSRG